MANDRWQRAKRGAAATALMLLGAWVAWAPGPRYWLVWDPSPNAANTLVYEIWSCPTPDGTNWTLHAMTTQTNFEILPRRQALFFRVRARDTNGLCSDWAK